ncbi:MAG TPA: hypothetical protein VN809_00195 [Telmatospirillum sp.]|nr:hypothetical protein [Telmatospirillum sp.]
MAISTETNTAISSLNWAQQVSVGTVVGAAASAATARTKKTRSERSDSSWILGELFPIAEIQSGIEEGLKASIRDAIGTLNSLLTDDKLNVSLQKLLGHPDDPETIARSLRDLTDAFANLSASPGQTAEGVVQAATTFTDKLKTTTDQIQALRARADTDIGGTVDKANAILRRIADLNTKISLAAAVGQPIRDIGVERDAALDTLSGTFDFASFSRDDGTVSVFTKAGIPLVNGPATQLEHRITEKIDPSATLANGRLAGVTADGQDISGHITSGTLHALLRTRDSTLPNVQNQLDTLAQTLQSQVNQVSNRALAFRSISSSCRSSRRFADPSGQYFSLSGGDVVITLLASDGTPKASTGLSLLMKQYLQGHGLPNNRAWSAGQTAAALNQWLGQQIGNRTSPYTMVNENGQIAFQLPQDTIGGLTFQDQRSFAFRSVVIANADKPLGLTGPIGFTDSAGNAISTRRASPPRTIVPGDSLTAIAAKLSSLDGLETSIVPAEKGVFLHVSSTIGSDMSVDPDASGANVVAGLGLHPAADQPIEDVVINYQPDSHGTNLTSAPRPDALTPLGLDGPLLLYNQDDVLIAEIAVDPSWSLATLASQINSVTKSKDVRASVVTAGNQVVLKLAPPLGQQLKIAGAPNAFHTRPSTTFVAAGGSLGIALNGTTVGKLTIKPGDDLVAIAEAINDPNAAFVARGITASLREVNGTQFLEIASASGLPLAFSGSSPNQSTGAISLHLNVRDSLGLSPPATQVISGFANFLGLNDLFIADPADAFDSKAPTGIFTSTATPGTAQTMALNPQMRESPSSLRDAALAGPMTELLRSPVNLAAAGGLARGNLNLTHYAETILATAAAQSQTTRGQMVYQQTLLDGLNLQHSRIGGMDMNDTMTTLTTYQQAFHDSSRIVSTMAQLFGSLGTPVH